MADGKCVCASCMADRDFEMPDAVIDACHNGKLVVFAGAGISTETRLVVPRPLYLELHLELEGKKVRGIKPFPKVMSAYEEAHGRPALLRRIKKHLGYVRSFPNIDGQASQFHRELAGLYTISEIVTTNWDDYFERECGCQPFVTEEDWAYWRSGERKVFKLHGSLSSPASIVATEADYARCYRNLNQGLMGAQLKTMLATKTVVFVGYSFEDSDFESLYRLMKRKMGDLLPRSYVVNPFAEEVPSFAGDMHLLQTSGVRFLTGLKDSFPESELLSEERFEPIPYVRHVVRTLHHKMIDAGEMRDDPAMFMCACYQDGLMDAFDYIMANKKRGDFYHRCYTKQMISDVYKALLDERSKEGLWHTAAYVEGYINGLLFLLADNDDRKLMPLYYIAGFDGDLREPEHYEQAAPEFKKLHPEAYEHARREAARLAPGVVFQHKPSI
jgi:NAD-dependent SIR2 family protein deacetylase